MTDSVGGDHRRLGTDGTDTLTNIERLQFSPDPSRFGAPQLTGRVVLHAGLNNEPVGSLTISDDTPAVNQLLTVSALGITDARQHQRDNPTGAITGGRSATSGRSNGIPARGVFTDIVAVGGGNPATALGNTFRVTADLAGLALRVGRSTGRRRRAGERVLRRRPRPSQASSPCRRRRRSRRDARSPAPATACISSAPTCSSSSTRS